MGLTNSDYEAVMREYDSIRYVNAELFKKRIEEAYNKIPELKVLEDEMITESAKLAKDSMFISDEAYAKAKEALDKKRTELAYKRKELLIKNGYDKDYLSKIYSCPLCKDTGFVNGNKCECFKSIAARQIYSNPAYMMADKTADFKHFREDYYKDNTPNGSDDSGKNALDAYSKLKNMADNFDTQAHNFVIYGGVGVGKTFLASCLANALIKDGRSVVFLTAFRFFDIFEKYTFHRDEADENTSIPSTEPLFDCDLLVIDDIGTEVSNSFTTSKLFDCLNERILSNKATVISTNLSPALIKATYSDRIFSRLVGSYSLLNLVGEDARMA